MLSNLFSKERQMGNLSQKKIELAKQFFGSWNAIAKSVGDNDRIIKDLDVEKFSKEYFEVKKAITGAETATGSSLVSSEYQALDSAHLNYTKGGAFRLSGAMVKTNQVGSAVFTGFNPTAKFVAHSSSTTAGSNDIIDSTGVTATVAINRYIAQIPIYDDPVTANYVNSPAQLFAVFEKFLEDRKMLLEDTLSAAAITSNASVTALATSSESYAKISSSIYRMITNLVKYGQLPAVYLNHSGLYSLLNERDANGQFMNDDLSKAGMKFSFANANGMIPEVGLVGYMMGSPVYVTSEILSTYMTDASNVITAQTGGNKTAVIVGLPKQLGIARGRQEFDFVTIFNPQNDRTQFTTGITEIDAQTYAGAGVINPVGFQYYAF